MTITTPNTIRAVKSLRQTSDQRGVKEKARIMGLCSQNRCKCGIETCKLSSCSWPLPSSQKRLATARIKITDKTLFPIRQLCLAGQKMFSSTPHPIALPKIS
jgi:hypothetical protein